MLMSDLMRQTLQRSGMTAVDSTYRALRKEYYGSHTFDFSEMMLVHLAMNVSEENDSTALKLLALNREFNPTSWFNEWATGQIFAEMGDTASAITALEKAVELNPNSRRAKRDLDMLKGGEQKKP